MPSLEELIEDFYQISGIRLDIVDSHFRTVLVESGGSLQEFCSLVHTSESCLKTCLASDKKAFLAAEKSGKTHVYTCPFGITEVMVPIWDGMKIEGYFFVSLGTRGEERASAARKAHLAAGCPEEDFSAALRNMPCYDEKTLKANLVFLELLAEHIGGHHLLETAKPTTGELIKRCIDTADRKITLAELGKTLHRSTVTLTQCFRKEFGMSIMDYVAERRLENACRMLAETTDTIEEIAFRCGYGSAEYFSRCFTKVYGIPPRLWAKRARQLRRESPETKETDEN